MPRRKLKIDEIVNEPVMGMTQEKKNAGGFWVTVGWALLLVGGLSHMLPEQMAPVLKYAAFGVSVQMAVGVLSVVLALYYLLGE